ncbi:glutamate--tRNA ligase [Kocuria palustris]|nr:glutamate--tRNA ligase [Kocuria palustris]
MKVTLAAKATQVAYPAFLLANYVNSTKDIDGNVEVDIVDDKEVGEAKELVQLEDGTTVIAGQKNVITYLAEKFHLHKGAWQWSEFALEKLYNKNFGVLKDDLEKLNAHLNLRSYIDNYSLTVSDIVVWGAIRANPLKMNYDMFINVGRWFDYLGLDHRFQAAIDHYVKLLKDLRAAEKVAKAGGKKETHKANFDIDLPGAEVGKVVTRFPPEPSGYLHIGHAKAAVLNEYFAHQYKGKLIIRFDDTNPLKERMEFQDSIIEDLALLGVKGDVVLYSLDYFDKMYDLALKMIKEGHAYCDDTPVDKMREERMDGIALARRDRLVEENLKIFTEEMKQGTEEGQKHCLRAKLDYANPNKALRDPVIYRCNLTPHHRTGTTWKMYPTYDFCAPVVDSLEGVTHALRTNEYRDRNPQYEWMIKTLGLRPVTIWDFARVNFVRTLLLKRKLQWFVDKQFVLNWDDPRFPTVRGVRRRGMTVEGLRNFIIAQGPLRNVINLEWSLIWALNKKIIDPICPRFTAIDAKDAVVVNLDGPAEAKTEQRPKHKKNPDVGTKPVIFANKILLSQEDAALLGDNEEVTLMDWGNAIVTAIHKDASGKVTSVDAKLNLDGDFRKTLKKLTWIADTPDKIKVQLVDFDHLITKDKLEEGDNFEDFITPQSEFKTDAIADLNVRDLKEGDIIQFERKGYYRLDKQGDVPVLFSIPDGKNAGKK